MALRTLVILVALVRIAAAQQVASDDPPPKPVTVKPAEDPVPPGPPWHFGLAFAGGGESIGDATFGQIGIAIHVSRRVIGRLALGVTGEMLTTNRTLDDGASTLIIGQTLRGLAGAEWTAYRHRKPFVPSVVVQGGVGRELTAWDRGTVDRGLVYAGVVARSGFDIPKRAPFHGIAQMATTLGLRFSIAPALPEMAIARACSQCGRTTSTGHDLGVMLHYGIAFGR
jgi:hypothetical protein